MRLSRPLSLTVETFAPASGEALDSLFVLRRIQAVLRRREAERIPVPSPQSLRPGSFDEYRPLGYFPWRTAAFQFPRPGLLFRIGRAARRTVERMSLEGRFFTKRAFRKLATWYPALSRVRSFVKRFVRKVGANLSRGRLSLLGNPMGAARWLVFWGAEVFFLAVGATVLAAGPASRVLPPTLRDPGRFRLLVYRSLTRFRRAP